MSVDKFKAYIVMLILDGKTEEALERLAKEYHTVVPNLEVGLPKGHKANSYGCYTPKNQTIYVQNSDIFSNPFVIIHEFYHHLRTKGVDRQHKGTESGADKFALDYLSEFKKACNQV
jgi:hypothetical protein